MQQNEVLVGGAVVLLISLGLSALFAVDKLGLRSQSGLATGTEQAPNILLIIADDMGVDKLGSYVEDADPDYRLNAEHLPLTPVLDQLAESGVRFTDAWANPSCSPTRAALFTGTHGFRNGVGSPIGPPSLTDDLSLDTVTLPEALAEVGYRSALIGKWHLGEGGSPANWAPGEDWHDHVGEVVETRVPPVEHGFSMFSGSLWGNLGIDDWSGYTDFLNIKTAFQGVHIAESTAEVEFATRHKVREALRWANRRDDEWLMVLSFNAPHTPLEVPPESCVYTAGEPESDIATYRSMVECLDSQIGALLRGLKDLDDTLIIFVGDNGTEREFAEGVYDDNRGKGTLYESGIRVPLIVADGRTYLQARPNFRASSDWLNSPSWVVDPGREVADPVHVVDLFATLAVITDAASESAVDSSSFLPLLQDSEGDIPVHAYAEQFDMDGTGAGAFRRDQFKLIVEVGRRGGSTCRLVYELYNVVIDRFEETDLAALEPDTLEQMVQGLDEMIAASGESSWLNVPDCQG